MEDPHAEVEIKPQVKPRDSVAKEEDPKPSHQLHKIQNKSTRSTRQTLCLWNTYERSLSTPTKENTLVLLAVDIGGKSTLEWTRLESELPPQQVQRSAQCWRAS